MNTRLLRRVAKHIAEEPRRLDMYKIAGHVAEDESFNPPCGTVGCIAGWACMLEGSTVGQATWAKGRRLLELDDKEAFQLFDYPIGGPTDGWPAKFANRFLRAKTPRGRASATTARIEHFIKTKGRE